MTNSLNHVAIIMDGNNRWAQAHDKLGISGHKAGAIQLKNCLKTCFSQEIKVVSVFAFSSENWQRSEEEVGGLMKLFHLALVKYKDTFIKSSISFKVIGRRDRFSPALQKRLIDIERATKNGKYTLIVAADYGGKWDITQAAKAIASKVQNNKLAVSDISEELIAEHCQLSTLPAIDLLIRTGGDQRISNFLLWQLAYSELYFTPCYWPDFNKTQLELAFTEFYSRQRRYGITSNYVSPETATNSTEDY